MSSFTSELWVTPLPDGRHWRLKDSFEYYIGLKEKGEVVIVPAGFVTDFASFPVFIWRFLMWWLPFWAKYSKPSPIHDQLYRSKKIMDVAVTRKRADEVFLEAMLVAWREHWSGKLIAYMEYYGVRVFGWLSWH